MASIFLQIGNCPSQAIKFTKQANSGIAVATKPATNNRHAYFCMVMIERDLFSVVANRARGAFSCAA